MSRWLAFDSSTDVLSIGLAVDGHVALRTLPGGAQASATLIPQVMALLAEAGLTLAQLDAIAFGRGPGSFTGLRTACAVAQGLAFGADRPVLPVDTLLAVAETAREQLQRGGQVAGPCRVLAVLDARMDEVYSATWSWDGAQWSADTPLQVCAPQDLPAPAPGTWLAGNAAAVYAGRLPTGVPTLQALPEAAALLRLAPRLWAQGLAVPAEQAMPLYVRDKVAQTTAEREAVRTAGPLPRAEGA